MNKMNVLAALDEVIALNAHLNNILTCFETGGNIDVLSRETLSAIKTASELLDAHDFPGAVTVQLNSQMQISLKLLSRAELLSGVTAQAVFTDDPRTLAFMIDAEIDSMIAEREHISRCEYEPWEESERLKIWQPFYYKPNREQFYGQDLLTWIRNAAYRLWCKGHCPSRYYNNEE